MQTSPSEHPSAPQRNIWLVASVAMLLLALPAAALILSGNNSGRAAFDATGYHMRFIRELAERFPDFDLTNPLTTTTPGYHILLAGLSRAGADSLEALRFATLAMGCAFVGTVAAWYARRTRPIAAIVLALPLVASVYVLGGAAWTVPDNLAWLLVFSILWLALMEGAGEKRLLLACVLLAALVCVRQTHIWLAAVIWAAAFSDARAEGKNLAPSLARASKWAVATLPAFLVLWLFVRHWGGLTPPRFQAEVQGVSPSTPAFLLLQVAILSVGFLPWTGPAVRRAWRSYRGVLLLAAAAGFLLAVIPETAASSAQGRWGGWWTLAGRLPSVAGHASLLIALAAPLGSVVVAALLFGVAPRPRAVLAVALLGFTAAVTANTNCWQRYHEPFLVCFLPACFLLQREGPEQPSPRRLAPTVALALMFWTISVAGFQGPACPADSLPEVRHRAPGDRYPDTPAAGNAGSGTATANPAG